MCIILYKKIADKVFLIKNRDLNYIPNIFIIHELINGTEVVYLRDTITEWVEGMNEHKIGIINASLDLGVNVSDNIDYQTDESNKLESKNKYLNLLSKSNILDIIFELSDSEYYLDFNFQGNTIISSSLSDKNNKSPELSVHFESKIGYNLHITPIINTNTYVCTNHGYKIRENCKFHGSRIISSVLRNIIAEYEVSDDSEQNSDLLLDKLSKNYEDTNLHISYHPYRLTTTGQLKLNLTDLIFVYKYNSNKSKFNGIINNLPKNYSPKIKIILEERYKDKHYSDLPCDKDKINYFIDLYSKK